MTAGNNGAASALNPHRDIRSLNGHPGPIELRVRRWIARHGDAQLLGLARQSFYRMTDLVHTENHDPRTNGELEVLRRLRPPVDQIIDVGAHRGSWALLANAVFPRATIHCFEIALQTRKILEETVRTLSHICVPPSGLLDKNGVVPLKYYPLQDQVSSIADYPHDAIALWQSEQVIRGDDYLDSQPNFSS